MQNIDEIVKRYPCAQYAPLQSPDIFLDAQHAMGGNNFETFIRIKVCVIT